MSDEEDCEEAESKYEEILKDFENLLNRKNFVNVPKKFNPFYQKIFFPEHICRTIAEFTISMCVFEKRILAV